MLSAPLPSSDAKSTEGNLCASVAAKSEIFLFFVCVLEYCNMPIFPVNSIILPNNNVLPAFLLVSGVERLKHQKLDRTPFDQGKFAILMIIVLGDVRRPLVLDRVYLLVADKLAGSTKWKKSDRERDHSRDASAKGSGLKSGRLSSGGSGRSGERKNKTKPKQKLAQLSTSGNVLGRVVEPLSSPAVQEPPPEPPSERKTQHPTRNTSSNTAQRPTTDAALPVLPGLDDILDVPGGLDGQGNDISSWFTDGLDDSLQDIDLSGALEIPDDDLTQLGFI